MMIPATILLRNAPYSRWSACGRRNFWQYLVGVFNMYDKDRVKEIGPDRAAAEWLLRNGAAVRWEGQHNVVTDYNQIGMSGGRYIETIDCTDSSVSTAGFRHLNGLKHVREVKLVRCWYLNDGALRYISENLSDTLEFLEVVSCCVSEEGLLALRSAKALKRYRVGGLPDVKNVEAMIDQLKSQLPSCQFEHVVQVDDTRKKRKSLWSSLFG